MPRLVDLKGQKIGRLTILERDYTKPNAKNAMWRCQCDCGNTTVTAGPNIGKTTFSCGCWVRENNSNLNRTHGASKTSEFGIWQGIQQRCHNPNNPRYDRYGARGIVMCERWRCDFRNFLYDMGARPSPKHSVERINNDGNYEPGNCEWALQKVQNRNYSRTNLIEINGEKLCVLDWCNRLNINRDTLYKQAKYEASPSTGGTREAVRRLLNRYVDTGHF